MASNNNVSVSSKHLIFKQATSSVLPSECERNIEKGLWLNRHVKSLVFDENSLKSVRFLNLEGLCMNNLTHLMITIRGFRLQEKNVLLQIARIKMPAISTCRLDSVLSSGEQECALLYVNLFEFLSFHARKIKFLVLRHSFRPYSNDKEGATKHLTLPVSWDAEKVKSVRGNLTGLSLEDLTIFLDSYEGREHFDLGLHVLSCQFKLSKLEVQIGSGSNANFIYPYVEKAIQQNSKTLEYFSLTRSNLTTPIAELENIIKALNLCPVLESLRLFVFTMKTFPQSLPPSLKLLDITGALHPNIILEIQNTLPKLEEMQFANVTEDFVSYEGEFKDNLKSLVQMPRLRMLRWYSPRFHLDFLAGKPGLSVKTCPNNVYASIIYINN